ncbi:hypothetical protein MTR67_048522 [Solanum verrucosum]|uniref:Uncharacterized protein n=1 Tax=Solanum verrucosum TaxID=315347 RepID=A0AAF0UZ04_SOLVR|nr:hypothetical protein MTR67_048522 [Solanum verrucosum]
MKLISPSFWAQVFLLPKKVLQQIETICKRFLWNGDAQTKGKALVAWDKLCWPKVAGGLNVTNVRPWEMQAKQASWVVRKILQAGHWISEAGLQMEKVMEAETFTMKDMYKTLRGELSKVPWRRMICNNQGSPKWTIHPILGYTKEIVHKR